MRKYISHINIKNYRQTPEQEQVSLASVPKQENKTDFLFKDTWSDWALSGNNSTQYTSRSCTQKTPTAWNLSRTTVCIKAVLGRRTALFKAEQRTKKCAGNDTECYNVSVGHKALSHC